MSGDYSRRRFDPRNHYSSVLMQQGRVQLDADWNEMAELYERRFRAERVDTFGRAAVPSTGADAANNARAFEVTIDGGRLRIGRGRIYVDGLLAENHGPRGPARLDPVLDEPLGGDQLPFAEQPYFDHAPLPPSDRPFLVYLDVWRREVTCVEDPALIEPAIGVDTTTRMQVAWQARVFTDAALTPGSRAGDITSLPAWQALVRPSGARLSVATIEADAALDPLILPADAGFRSLDNQLYRIEIHDGGAQPQGPAEVKGAGRPTFKWSRDNGAIQSRVLAIQDDVVLVVDSLGRDDVLRIREGDWVELRDDLLEGHRIPGVMARVTRTDDEERTIRLHAPLAELLAARADIQALTAPFPDGAGRHLRVRRWDQQGEVRDDQGVVLVDLSKESSGGLIPVPEPGRFVVLERGIKIAFATDASGGPGALYRTVDHWSFAARADDGSVELLDEAPPAGDHHHFALLGLVTLAPPVVSDLRTLVQPPKGEGAGCCTIHVSPEDHNSGVRTIQSALADLAATGGTVCLDVGVYRLIDDAIRIDGGRNLALRGQGRGTVIARQYKPGEPNPTLEELQGIFGDAGPDEARLLTLGGVHAALCVSNTVGFVLEDLTLESGEDGFFARYQTSFVNCAAVRIERCALLIHSAPPDLVNGKEFFTAHAAIALHQSAIGLTIRDNYIAAQVGVVGFRVFSADLRIEGNVLQTPFGGLLLGGWFPAQGARIVDNQITAAMGIFTGGVSAGGTVEIRGNTLDVTDDGISTTIDDVVIVDNTVVGAHARPSLEGDRRRTDNGQSGISVERALVGIRARIADNVVRHVLHGIRVSGRCEELVVEGNRVERVAESGIVVDRGSSRDVVIRGNTIRDLAFEATPREVVGIRVIEAETIVIEDNHLEQIAALTEGWETGTRVLGIVAQECLDLVISRNHVRDCGPAQADQPLTVMAISARMFATRLEVRQNVVGRRTFHKTSVSTLALFVQQEPSPEDRSPIVIPSPEGGRVLALGGRIVPVAAPTHVVIAENQLTTLWSPATIVPLRELRSDSTDLPGMPVLVSVTASLLFTGNRVAILTPQDQPRNNLFIGELSCVFLTITMNHWTHSGGFPGPLAPLLRFVFHTVVQLGETQIGIRTSATNFNSFPIRDTFQNLGLPGGVTEPFT